MLVALSRLRHPLAAGSSRRSTAVTGYWQPDRAESFISCGVFGDPAQASLRAVRLLIDGDGRRDDIAGTRVTDRSAHGIIECLAGPVQHRLVPVAPD